MNQVNVKLFFRSILQGILGIASEVLMVFFFIITGFIVCLLWWSCIR